MKKFLIQTVDGMVRHDFGFHLVEAIRYHNWYYNEKVYEYLLSETPHQGHGYIPVGSLEFVFDYIEIYHNIDRKMIKPINIPKELMSEEFLKRKVYTTEQQDIVLEKEMFVKSQDSYKSFTEITKDATIIPKGNYLVSEVVDIVSEWRCFVHAGKLVGLQNYSGDFARFPEVKAIEKMIDIYASSPVSYTLDVGVNVKGTFVIEVHPYVSCGQYGFSDYKILPIMFEQGFEYLLKNE